MSTPHTPSSQQSKLSEKGQTTIPHPIRQALGLKPGDTLEYQLTSTGQVLLVKARAFDTAWHQALQETLTEWNRPEDDDLLTL